MPMVGLDVIKGEMGKSAHLVIKDGEHAVIRILTPSDEIVGVYEHVEQMNGRWVTVTCLGKNECPLCQAGKSASFRAYMVVADVTDSNRVKLFKISRTVVKQMLGLVEEYGDITSRDFKVSRTGKGFDTTYQFFARDAKPFELGEDIELPDLKEVVAPKTREEILALMNDTVIDVSGGGVSEDDDLPF